MSEIEKILIDRLNFRIQVKPLYFQQFKKPDEAGLKTRS